MSHTEEVLNSILNKTIDNAIENHINANDKSDLSAVSIKLPQFWPECPAVWFIRIESQFNLRGITNEKTKFEYVVSALPQDIILSVLDVIQHPNDVKPYSVLKEKLVERHSLSEEKRIEKLLSNTELGDQKPSDFYRSLEAVAGPSTTFSSDLLQKLWLRRLPSTINIALLAAGQKSIDELLTIADKIYEASNSSSISAVSVPKSSTSEKIVSDLCQAIGVMNTKYQKLENELSEIKSSLRQNSFNREEDNFQYRGRSPARKFGTRSRSYSRARSNNRSTNHNSDYCWYHDSNQLCWYFR